MMKVKKRTYVLIVLLLLSFHITFLLCGCAPKMREEGNFTYYIRNGFVNISELTEIGTQQKILVIPEEIDGIKVTAIEKWKPSMWSSNVVWESEKLEKVFFLTSKIDVYNGIFRNCVNLGKIVAINFDVTDGAGGGGTMNSAYNVEHYLHISKQTYDVCTFFNRDMFLKPANVTYFYNYEIDINYGEYWIDDVDYGDIIEYIPQNPIRDEYNFDGWYREEECTNKWNFAIDTMPKEKLDEDGKTIYQELKLYAKWVKK